MEDRSVLTRAASRPDETWAYADGPDQVVDMWHAADARRTVVVAIHGGYWRPAYDRAHLGPMCEALAVAGFDCAAIEFRRIPGDPDAMLSDVSAALQSVAQRVEGRPLVAVGHSAGGHLALWAAAVSPPPSLVGTVALAPVADLARAEALNVDDGAVTEFLGCAVADRPDIDPMTWPAPPSSVIVIHGDRDGRVPIELSESYAVTHGARMEIVAGADHFSLIDPLSDAWTVVRGSLDALAEA